MVVRVGSGGPPGGLRWIRRPTRRWRKGREAHPEVWKRLGGLPGGLGWVERPSQLVRSFREALP